MGTYKFCVRAIFVEAAVFVAAGFLVGLVYDSWKAVFASQLLLLVCELAGYVIENWLHRGRNAGERW